MQIASLRTYNLPDVSDHVIHFTGRNGLRINVGLEITGLAPQERLAHILVDGLIRGFQTFGAGAPVVCFTESTKPAVTRLVAEQRYEPCGIGFSKQLTFDRSGGPAMYVRGDEWDAATQALPFPLRSRLVRFWPGAQPDPGEILPSHLTNPSEWLHEREWRVPTEFRFTWTDVRFLIVPDVEWQAFYTNWIEGWAGPEYAAVFAQIPVVVLDALGNVVLDAAGIWAAANQP